jgi:putative ABC transport system permease protein
VQASHLHIVGGLGLMGTMGMNVLERRREIGVMRSIGAVDRTVYQLVVGEGLLIGLISRLADALVAVPITSLLGRLVCESRVYLTVSSSRRWASGSGCWSCWWWRYSQHCSRRGAGRLTVRDVRAYE